MRGYDLVALCAAGSGHAGGTLSIMDITAALYLAVARHDPKNPDGRTGTGLSGQPDTRRRRRTRPRILRLLPDEEVVALLRKLYSPFQGHPTGRSCPESKSQPAPSARACRLPSAWPRPARWTRRAIGLVPDRRRRAPGRADREAAMEAGATSDSTTWAASSTRTACRSTAGSKT